MVEIRLSHLTSFQICLGELGGHFISSAYLLSICCIVDTKLGLSNTKQKRWYGPVISSLVSNVVS